MAIGVGVEFQSGNQYNSPFKDMAEYKSISSDEKFSTLVFTSRMSWFTNFKILEEMHTSAKGDRWHSFSGYSPLYIHAVLCHLPELESKPPKYNALLLSSGNGETAIDLHA